jgi:hypothetical protein
LPARQQSIPLCPGNPSNWTLLHISWIIRDWWQFHASYERSYKCQALWSQFDYQRRYKCSFSNNPFHNSQQHMF